MRPSELGTLAIVRSLPGLLGAERLRGDEELEELGEDLEAVGVFPLLLVAPALLRAARNARARRGYAQPAGRAYAPARAPAPRDTRAAWGARGRGVSRPWPWRWPWRFRGDEDLGELPSAAGVLSYIDQKVAQVQAGIEAAAQGAVARGAGLIAEARDGLWQAYYQAGQAFSTTAGDAMRTLAQRAGDSLQALGEGAGAAFAAFWGFKPGEGLALGGLALALLALAFGAGAVYVATSPGGQAYLAAVGTGAGRAVASMGAGYGSAASSAGAGAGQALVRIADVGAWARLVP